jgi:hypothetical protein
MKKGIEEGKKKRKKSSIWQNLSTSQRQKKPFSRAIEKNIKEKSKRERIMRLDTGADKTRQFFPQKNISSFAFTPGTSTMSKPLSPMRHPKSRLVFQVQFQETTRG